MCDPSLHRGQHGIVETQRLCGGGALPRRDGAEPRHHTMHCLEPFDSLGGYPILLARNFRYDGAILELQALKESSPAGGEPRVWFPEN